MNSETSTIRRTEVSRGGVPPLRIPRSLAVAGLIVSGIWLSESLQWSVMVSMAFACGTLAASVTVARYRLHTVERLALSCGVIGLGATLWSVRGTLDDSRDIGQLVSERHLDSGSALRVSGVVSSIPVLDVQPASAVTVSERTQTPRTLFLLKARSVTVNARHVSVRGLCRIQVDGDATQNLRWGDRIEVTGQIDLAPPPTNPGEFDYARHLRRCGISAMMFVKHPAAAKVLTSRWWHPSAVLSEFRQQAVLLMRTHLSNRNHATAEALLLGNRGHLAADLERDFAASGTMHLLAISGLHVGILYVFLVRTLNVMLLPRNRALVLAGMVCVLYCFLTDLRPSVMRATVFIVLHIIGQILCRDMRMGALIGTTTLILVIFDPSLAFDIGAWLSFAAVGALGWVSERTPPAEDRPVPPDAVSWQDQVRDLWQQVKDKLSLSYRQMLAVTLLSAPLVASQFHIVSLTGMIINVALIPFTAMTLISGYVFLGVGLCLPPLAIIPGTIFGAMLWVLNAAVACAADIRLGFITIPDLPVWFLPAYFTLLGGSAAAVHAGTRSLLRSGLLILVIGSLWKISSIPASEELVCTVLNVGHGNAIVVETPEGKVLLFDAGALNRGDRTADLVSRFLWSRGYRMIDALVISHADADHYNAVSGLLDRVPAGQVLCTREFVRSKSPDVAHVLNTAAGLSIPCQIAMNGDRISVDKLTIEFLQARLPDSGQDSDNALSLVTILRFAGRTICLPGDLEGQGLKQLLQNLPKCDLLLSPHHGSLSANSLELAERISPQHVVVSAKSDQVRTRLQDIYGDAVVTFTGTSGAVTYRVAQTGESSLQTFLSGQSVSQK